MVCPLVFQMPAKKPCRISNCPKAATNGYCDDHASRRKSYDPQQEAKWDRPGHHLYSTARWKQLRAEKLRQHPLCKHCAERGIVTVATQVDHITPHRGDEHLFWHGPFQSLCASCHSAKSRQDVMDRKSKHDVV
ncbi:HNH endonuclease [Paludibaculum fermentans]|uniref:HNH endonuclease n=1 Tax=Paludibaculum fermentans TaxID=1473598 RepID=UPI003EBE0723